MLLVTRSLVLAPAALLAVASLAGTARADDGVSLAPNAPLLGASVSGDGAPRVTLLPGAERADASAKPPTRMNSRALFGTGVALSTLGTAGLVLGGVFYANMQSDEANLRRISQRCPTCLSLSTNVPTPNSFGAITSFVAGGVLTAVGVPMIVVGSLRKPVDEAPQPAAAPRAEFSVGAARASMTVRF